MTINIAETGANVGDAIDDITDLARDLWETRWRWEKNSPDPGLWNFKTSYESHWSQHLRRLQIYLLNLERGT